MRIASWALACAALGPPGCAGVETDRRAPAASTAVADDAETGANPNAKAPSRRGRLEWELLDPHGLEVLESGVLTPAAFDFQTRMRRENGANRDPILRRWVSVEEQRNVLLEEYARFASRPRPLDAADEGTFREQGRGLDCNAALGGRWPIVPIRASAVAGVARHVEPSGAVRRKWRRGGRPAAQASPRSLALLTRGSFICLSGRRGASPESSST